MRHLPLAIALLLVPLAPVMMPELQGRALAQRQDASAKDAFDAARELGTVDAWNAFLASYPTGFYADLARAYIKKLGGDATVATPAPSPAPTPPAQPAPVAAPANAPAPPATATAGFDLGDLAPTDPGKPAVVRGARYMGFTERFNRYYTDASWKPSRTLYVSPNGTGNGETRATPMSPIAAVASARPGTRINFIRGNYQGCFEFTKENGGTYDNPVVVYAERNEDKSLGVALTCCSSGRQTCFNLEAADYVAIDGFEMIGGRYGVRAVGADYDASKHSRGIAVIDNKGHDQDRDPFFSAQADWAVWERNVAYGAQKGDGHGIYLSNGSDWNIVRFNETYGNVSSDFQINADPTSTCKDVGIPFNDPRCDAYAGTGEGGRGASDYFLVDGNYFHHSIGPGPNFTSVRRSVVRNNIFGPQTTRHNVSFWQETDNPRLGSSDNRIVHNLFISTGRHAVNFSVNSTRNLFANNVLVGVREGTTTANPSALLMEVDDTVGANIYRQNLYIAGKLDGRSPNAQEIARPDFSANWFAKFPGTLNHDPGDFKPSAGAPFLGLGTLSPDAPTDRTGARRTGKVDLGPIKAP